MSKYSRYQDYVIKDGKLIGEFEEMYKDFEDPWEQTIRETAALEKQIGINLMKRYRRKMPIEYGCGLGHYTEELRINLGSAVGVDISKTAIEKAKRKYPECTFIAADLLDSDSIKNAKADCILMVEISWYVLEKLQAFKKQLAERYSGQNVGFFHTLMTYGPGLQKYGNEYFTNLADIMKYWSDIIDITDWGEISKKEYAGGKRTFLYGNIR